MYTMTIQAGLVSVIIPARNELFLQKTIKDILVKAKGPIEIIVVLDGYWVKPEEIVEDDRVTYVHFSEPRGMRNAINKGAEISHGEFLLKSDAHCMFDEGFDLKLKEGIPEYEERVASGYKEWLRSINAEANYLDKLDSWIVIPRRLRLDPENWCIQESDKHKPPIDYEYLSSPAGNGAKGNIWNERTLERMNKPEYEIDENMSFQGSCYFLTRNHYLNRLGGMSEEGYGNFVREAQEIGLKTWLGGGKVFVNKKTWYAHLHKGPKYGRMYFIDKFKMIAGNEYCDDFWFNNRWDKAIYDMAWFINRFMPVPTWTPELVEQVRKK